MSLKGLGRKDEARASFARVGELASEATSFQRKEARVWVLRSLAARLF